MQMQPVDLLGPIASIKGAGGAGTGNATSPFHAVQQQAIDKQASPQKGKEKDVLQANVPPDSPREPLKESSPSRKDPDETAENAAETTVAFPQNAGGEARVTEPRAAQSSGMTGAVAVVQESSSPNAVLASSPPTPSLEKAGAPLSGPAPETAKIDVLPDQPAQESVKTEAKIDSLSAQPALESALPKAKIDSLPAQPALESAQLQAKTAEKAEAPFTPPSAESNQAKGVFEKVTAAPAPLPEQGTRVIPLPIQTEASPVEQSARPLASSFLQMELSQGGQTQANTQAAVLSQTENIKGKDSASSTSMGRMFSEIIGNIKAQGPLRQENQGSPVQRQETTVASFLNSGETGRITLEGAVFSTAGGQDSAEMKPLGAVFGQGQTQGFNGNFVSQGNEAHLQTPMISTSPSNQTPDTTGIVRLPSGAAIPEAQVMNGVIENMAVRIRPLKETHSITIRMHPEELGRLKIELEVNKDSVRAHLIAQNQQSHEILERNLPKLREALEQQGLKLDDIQVDIESGQNAGSRGSFEDQRGSAFHRTAKAVPLTPTPEQVPAVTQMRPAWSMDRGSLSMHV